MVKPLMVTVNGDDFNDDHNPGEMEEEQRGRLIYNRSRVLATTNVHSHRDELYRHKPDVKT